MSEPQSAKSAVKPSNVTPAGVQSEAEFLREQAHAAKAAIVATIADMKSELSKGIDPRELARRHPWAAMVSSLVGGFAAGATMLRGKEVPFWKKLHATSDAAPASKPAGDAKPAVDAASKPVTHVVAEHLIELASPILMSVVTGAVKRLTTTAFEALNSSQTTSGNAKTPPADGFGPNQPHGH